MLRSQPAILAWQVGEALAETLHEEEVNAFWPWNSARDRKTPQANLLGADLLAHQHARVVNLARGATTALVLLSTKDPTGQPGSGQTHRRFAPHHPHWAAHRRSVHQVHLDPAVSMRDDPAGAAAHER